MLHKVVPADFCSEKKQRHFNIMKLVIFGMINKKYPYLHVTNSKRPDIRASVHSPRKRFASGRTLFLSVLEGTAGIVHGIGLTGC